MPFSLRCADSGVDCPGMFVAETEQELIEHVEIHAAIAHPDIEMTTDVLESAKTLIKRQ